MPLTDVSQQPVHPHSVDKSPAKRKAEEDSEVDQENRAEEGEDDMGAAR